MRPGRPGARQRDRFHGCPYDHGALIVFALFLFVLMAMMGGVAIDVLRYETTRTHLSQTLDRCTLMAAGLTQRLDPQSVFEDCVEKAGLADKLESVVVLDGLSSRDVQATARAATNPFFLHLIGIDEFDAKALQEQMDLQMRVAAYAKKTKHKEIPQVL